MQGLQLAVKGLDLRDNDLDALGVLRQEVLKQDELELNPGLILVQELAIKVRGLWLGVGYHQGRGESQRLVVLEDPVHRDGFLLWQGF